MQGKGKSQAPLRKTTIEHTVDAIQEQSEGAEERLATFLLPITIPAASFIPTST